jgi:hypothetical protein
MCCVDCLNPRPFRYVDLNRGKTTPMSGRFVTAPRVAQRSSVNARLELPPANVTIDSIRRKKDDQALQRIRSGAHSKSETLGRRQMDTPRAWFAPCP